MGILDVLNGMANGPHGQTNPNAKGGMSPMTMAIVALLAYKGIKYVTSSSQAGAAPPQPGGMIPSNPGLGGALSGGGDLGSLLKGGLGGLLAGGAAGSILSGGLDSLVKQFQQNGQGEAVQSWVGNGPNKDISVNDLAKSIGIDDLNSLSQHLGISSDELLSGLRKELPAAVDEMTPQGRVPTAGEASHWL